MLAKLLGLVFLLGALGLIALLSQKKASEPGGWVTTRAWSQSSH